VFESATKQQTNKNYEQLIVLGLDIGGGGFLFFLCFELFR